MDEDSKLVLKNVSQGISNYANVALKKAWEQSGDSCQKIFLSQIGREIRQMLITEIPLWMQMVRLPRMWSFVIVR